MFSFKLWLFKINFTEHHINTKFLKDVPTTIKLKALLVCGTFFFLYTHTMMIDAKQIYFFENVLVFDIFFYFIFVVIISEGVFKNVRNNFFFYLLKDHNTFLKNHNYNVAINY